METKMVLLVAHQTALAPSLAEAVERRMDDGPVAFVLLVPCRPAGGEVGGAERAWAAAEERAEKAVGELRELGAAVEGRVGVSDPFVAIEELLQTEVFDEIVISTLPQGLSGWLGLDLVTRVTGLVTIPVAHIVFDPAYPTGTHPDWDRPVGRY